MSLPPFQALLDEHGESLYGYLVAVVGPEDAGDCFQETMLAALRAYPTVADDSRLRSWLFTIAYRKMIDGHRARVRRPVPVDVGSVDVGSVEGGAEHRSEPPDGSVWAAVRGLPPKQRSAVAWRYLADLPYREIGRLLECSEEAARQNVRAGLRTIREGMTP